MGKGDSPDNEEPWLSTQSTGAWGMGLTWTNVQREVGNVLIFPSWSFVAQLVGASSQYAKVVGLIPGHQ